jgi:hypothetical protein
MMMFSAWEVHQLCYFRNDRLHLLGSTCFKPRFLSSQQNCQYRYHLLCFVSFFDRFKIWQLVEEAVTAFAHLSFDFNSEFK